MFISSWNVWTLERALSRGKPVFIFPSFKACLTPAVLSADLCVCVCVFKWRVWCVSHLYMWEQDMQISGEGEVACFCCDVCVRGRLQKSCWTSLLCFIYTQNTMNDTLCIPQSIVLDLTFHSSETNQPEELTHYLLFCSKNLKMNPQNKWSWLAELNTEHRVE